MKKSAKKKNKRSGLDYARMVVFCLLIVGFMYTLVTTQIKLSAMRHEKAQCHKEIASQQEKKSRLEEKAKYNSSDESYENKARDEGYVRSDETVFVVGN